MLDNTTLLLVSTCAAPCPTVGLLLVQSTHQACALAKSMRVWRVVLCVAYLQTAAALAFFTRAVSSKTCVAAKLVHSAGTACAQRAQQHCTVTCSSSPSPQQRRPDRSTFSKQVQLSKDLSSMKYGRWREVVPRLRQARSDGIPFNAYIISAAITVLDRAKQFDDVMKLWQLMQRDGVKPNVPVHNALIDACSKSGHAAKACEYLQQMHAEGLTPDVKSHSAAIDACARCGMADKAFEVLEQMVTAGITPNVVSYNAVINVCSKAGQYQLAVATLKQVRSDGLTPDRLSYNKCY
jgi:pentatricopeptide repeat protein